MKRFLPLLTFLPVLLLAFLLATAAPAFAQKASELKYTDARELMLINQGYDNTELYYSRLPEDMKPVTRKGVWELGLNSAGLAIRFSTNSKAIGIRWTLLNYFIMHHMAGTGIRGIDLYRLDENEHWHFIGTAIPNGKDTTKTQLVVSDMDGLDHDYMAYLPLYDGVTKVEIGVTKEAKIGQPHRDVLIKGKEKPIVFYGTSITQGGCASRPGMVYTSIISRALQKECINLGFSGNARMDKALAQMIARIDADQYVIDCLENCTIKMMRDSAWFFLTYLGQKRPDAPIYMVEHIWFSQSSVSKGVHDQIAEKNKYWRELYEKLRNEGYNNFRYIPADNLTGPDGEGAVDGTHQTDLGFLRMSEEFLRYLRR
ncbi:MAG: SGNH/GDSL hydrolase family protein [Bacteroidales bacterium]|nr:SGNH/GDSL hydrolase family protein [Bacteroidales bacterium]MBR5018933.1 SGNH/GDSL hydrolase family protein [Bacteroidales bacterium]